MKPNLKITDINETSYMVESSFDLWYVEILPNDKHKLYHKNKSDNTKSYHKQGIYNSKDHVLKYIHSHDCYKVNRWGIYDALPSTKSRR